jgi:hypothetical protein
LRRIDNFDLFVPQQFAAAWNVWEISIAQLCLPRFQPPFLSSLPSPLFLSLSLSLSLSLFASVNFGLPKIQSFLISALNLISHIAPVRDRYLCSLSLSLTAMQL